MKLFLLQGIILLCLNFVEASLISQVAGHLFPFLKNSHHHITVHPYPHYTFENFLPEELFRELQRDFPVIPPSERKLYNPWVSGKYQGYQYQQPPFMKLLETSPAYRKFNDYVNSSAFVEWAMDLYGPILEKGRRHYNCSIDPKKASFRYHFQDFTDAYNKLWIFPARKKGQFLEPGHDNNRMFSRIDLLHGYNGVYSKGIHQDMPDMILGVLIYLDDVHESAGGNFVLYRNWQPAQKIRPKANMAITQLSGWMDAYHAAEFFNDTTNPLAQRRAIHIELHAHQSICRDK